MYIDEKLEIAIGEEPVYLLPEMCNRHGLIAGATGTGKTVTLKTIAQSMSDAGIPTFLADIKGDVSGMAIPGEGTEKLVARLAKLGIDDYDFHACPVRFWDVYGEQGTPVRTTITEMGPVLLSRLLGLTDVQQGVLNIAFHVADDMGMLLLDLKDLRSMVNYLAEHADEFNNVYGSIAKTSVGAIQRALLQLEDAGGDIFFGEPALDISDWLACDSDGKGYVNILDCVKLVQSPLLYSTFLLWMLSELYEMLPEVGDVEKPKVCFFFDEAHLLFDDAPKALMDKIEQVVKLVRSKGVGVYFITQNPADIPDTVLAQLGNRVQHALRAYTPAEQKAIRAAADSFRANPAFKTDDAITELGTGEALISFLDEDGKPGIVQRAMVIAPACSMDAAPDMDKRYIIDNGAFMQKYKTSVDRDSAYEILNKKAAEAVAQAEHDAYMAELERQRLEAEKEAEKLRAAAEKQAERERLEAQKELDRQQREYEKEIERRRKELEREAERAYREQQKEVERLERQRQQEIERQRREQQKREEARRRQTQRMVEDIAGEMFSSFTGANKSTGKSIARGVLGTLFGGR